MSQEASNDRVEAALAGLVAAQNMLTVGIARVEERQIAIQVTVDGLATKPEVAQLRKEMDELHDAKKWIIRALVGTWLAAIASFLKSKGFF